jgi:hypothetical protein
MANRVWFHGCLPKNKTADKCNYQKTDDSFHNIFLQINSRKMNFKISGGNKS